MGIRTACGDKVLKAGDQMVIWWWGLECVPGGRRDLVRDAKQQEAKATEPEMELWQEVKVSPDSERKSQSLITTLVSRTIWHLPLVNCCWWRQYERKKPNPSCTSPSGDGTLFYLVFLIKGYTDFHLMILLWLKQWKIFIGIIIDIIPSIYQRKPWLITYWCRIRFQIFVSQQPWNLDVKIW